MSIHVVGTIVITQVTSSEDAATWFLQENVITTVLKRRCKKDQTQEKKHRGRHWVIDGAVTPDAMCKYGSVGNNECKLCADHHCKEWNHLRLQLEPRGKVGGAHC